MKIMIVHSAIIPVHLYGGIERVIWDLGKELVRFGHEVIYLVEQGSQCNFAEVLVIDESREITEQIPEKVDLVHFHFVPPNLDKIKNLTSLLSTKTSLLPTALI